MNDSTKRSIRTGFDVALGALATAIAVVPTLGLLGLDTDSVAVLTASLIAATAAVSKLRNQLEDAGLLKARLK